MALKIGDRVRVRYGVMYKGYDLTHKMGIIKNLDSYVEIYISDLGIIAKMFRHEIEEYHDFGFDEITKDDIDKLFQ